MARVLDPAAFGVVAVAQVFVGFAGIYSDLGLGAALVRRSALNVEVVATAFYGNLLTGFAFAGIIVGLSVPLSDAYRMHGLVLVLCIAALQVAVNVTVVPLALLERAFRFRRVAVIEISAAVISVLVTVSMAIAGYGPVSLVTGPVAGFAIQGVLLWSTTRVVPRGRPTRSAARELWAYSGPYMIFSTVNYWLRNVDNLVLGIVAGAVALGLYTRAYALMLVPVQQVTVVLGRVLLPTLSRRQNSIPEMRSVYVRVLRLSTAVTVPLGVAVACLSSPLVSVLFGEHWHRMVPLLAILAATTPIQVIVTTSGPIYQALGETRKWGRRAAIVSLLTMIAMCAGAAWGAEGVAVGFAASTVGLSWFALTQPWQLIGLRMRVGLGGMGSAVASAIFMGASLVGVDLVANRWNPAVWLGAGVIAGSGVYLLALGMLDNRLIGEWVAAFRRGEVKSNRPT